MTFIDIIKEYFNNHLKGKQFHDDTNDIKIKLSLYSLFSRGLKLYMVESAIAAVITVFSYNQSPLEYLKSQNEECSKFLEDIQAHNKSYAEKHGGIEPMDLTSTAFGPVLNLTGYVTWVKRIISEDNFTSISDVDLGHKHITDAYAENTELISMPYVDDTIWKIDKQTFQSIARYERERVKCE